MRLKYFCVMHLLVRLLGVFLTRRKFVLTVSRYLYGCIIEFYFPNAIIEFSPQISILTTYLYDVMEQEGWLNL